MRPKSERDFVAGLMFVLIGAGFAYASMSYDFGSAARPGPGYFPFGLGVLLALLGGGILFKSVTVETADREPVGGIAWRPLSVVVLSILVFALLLPRLGLPLTVLVVATGVAYASDEARLPTALATGAFLSVFCTLAFVYGLKLQIPLWPAPLAAWGL